MHKSSVLLTIVVLTTYMTLAGACGGGTQVQTPTPMPTAVRSIPTPTAEPVLNTESVDVTEERLAEFRSAVARAIEGESFHFTLDASIEAEVAGISLDISVLVVGDFAPPDRSKANLSINMGFVSSEFDAVSAGGESYATDPQTGQWSVIPQEDSGLFDSPHELVGLVAQAAHQMELVGQGSIGGISVLHLRAEGTQGALTENSDDAILAEAWVGVDDLRPHRLRLVSTIDLSDLGRQFPSQIGDGPANLDATIGLSEFGTSVTVDAPEVQTFLVDGRLPGTKMNEQINLVIDFGESHPDYSSTPATSGWHYGPPDAPVSWGVHSEFIPHEILLQNLAQGGIGLHYNCPGGCPDVVAAFSELAGRYPKIVVSPYEGMDGKIALTAWTYLDVMDELDLERVELFIRAHHGSERAPEHFKP